MDLLGIILIIRSSGLILANIDNQFLVINPSSGKVTVNSEKFDELKKHVNDQLDLLKENLNGKVEGTTNKINDFDSTLKSLTNRLESEGNPV